MSCSPRPEAIPPVIDDLAMVSVTPDPAAQACAACHADIVAQWQDSQHAHANRLVSDAEDRGAFDPPVTIEHGSFTTSMRRERDGRYTFTTVFSNQPPDVYTAESVIAITPLRQYLVAFPGGRLQVVDISYDPRSNEWFNAFGEQNRQPHEWGFWKNRSMTWNVQCAFCHTTGFEKNYDIKTDSYASTWNAMGISCAQCHQVREQVSGVRFQEAGNTNQCPMLEPQHPETRNLKPETVMDNCASCHARREELFGTFKPGDRFHDHFRLTLPDSPMIFHHDGQVLDEDFEYASFMMSRMGHKGVTCLDCHNPHSGKLVAPYENNALCMQCHIPPGLNGATPIDPISHSFHEPGTIGSRCVDCHMPVHYYMVRDGRRDHGFTSPDPLLTIEHGIPNACNMCHDDQSAEWARDLTVAWYGDKMERRARDRARVVARAHAGDDTVVEPLLAMAQSEEIAAWRAALNGLMFIWAGRPEVRDHLTADLEHASPLVRSASVRALQNRGDAAEAIAPLLSDPSALVRIDAAWHHAGSGVPVTAERVRELKAYLDNISDQPAGALRQAQFALQSGSAQEAEAWAEKALAWDPTPVPQYALGRIQHINGDVAAAISNIAAAALSDTNNAEYSFAVALLYAETGSDDLTVQWLEETVLRDRGFGRAWYNLGLAYAQAERLDEAAKALAQAERAMPGTAEPPYALATVYMRMGRWPLAADAARRTLAADPAHRSARQILARAEAEVTERE